jgi:hypothetical protein
MYVYNIYTVRRHVEQQVDIDTSTQLYGSICMYSYVDIGVLHTRSDTKNTVKRLTVNCGSIPVLPCTGGGGG